ncbi:AsmA family protein [Arenibaculum sp.]|uniref:AsmA family protein n=1 Tax=Arenibaculum sp. TaxID=2865862 RepID=UPI002E1466DE|nr:AsmA family protein [Arenibaculum sp.]
MKKLFIGLAVLLVAAVAAVLVVPSLVDWNRYRDEIAARVTEATGRQLTLDGEIDLALLPRPTLKVTGARISNVPGAQEAEMARLRQLDVRVALMPLLSGTVQVRSITLVQPEIVLEVLEDGRRNWDFATGPEAAPRRMAERGLLDSVSLDRVSIEDGTVVYRNAVTGTLERFESVDATVVAGSLAGPFQIQGTLSARGVPLAVEMSAGRIGEGGALPLRTTVGLSGTDAALRFAGIVTTGSAPRLQGDLKAEGTDLRGPAAALLTAAGQIPADAMPALVGQPFNLRTAVNASMQLVELNAIEGRVGDTHGTGTVRIHPGEPDRAEISLGFNRFDLDAWAAVAASTAEGGGPFELTLPQGVEATLALSVDALNYGGGIIRQGRVEANLADGVLTVHRAAALLPGASDLALAGTLAEDGGRPVFDFQAEANSENLRAVLEWLRFEVGAVPEDRLRKFSLAGRVSGQPDAFQVSGLDLRVDTTVMTGAVAYADRGRPGFGIRLDVDRMNLDAYRPVLAGLRGGALGAFDANLDARAEDLTLGGVPARGLRVDATLNEGALTLRELSATDLSGVAVGLSGSVADLAELDGIDLAFDMSAASLAPVYRGLDIDPVLPAELVGAVGLAGRVAGNPDRLAVEVETRAANGTVQAGGTVSGLTQVPNYDLKVRGTWKDARDLARALFPDWRPADPGTFDLYAEVQGSDTVLSLSAIQGGVGATSLAGEATVDLADARPSVMAELEVGDLVLDRFLPPSTTARLPQIPLPISQAIASGEAAWSDEPVALGWLRSLDGRFGIEARSVEHGGRRIEDAALRADLSDGVLAVEDLEAGYEGGRLSLSGALAGREDGGAGIELRLALAGASIDEGIAGGAADARVDVTGVLDLELALQAAGASEADLVRSLDGTGSLSMRDGRIVGIDLAGLEGRLSGTVGAEGPAQAVDALLADAVAGGGTPFESLQAGIRFEDGVARLEELALSVPGAQVAGGGAVDLGQWLIDLTLGIDPEGEPPSFGLALAGAADRPQRQVTSDGLVAWAEERTSVLRAAEEAEARRVAEEAAAREAAAKAAAAKEAAAKEAAAKEAAEKEKARRAAAQAAAAKEAAAKEAAAKEAAAREAASRRAAEAPSEPATVIDGILQRLRR